MEEFIPIFLISKLCPMWCLGAGGDWSRASIKFSGGRMKSVMVVYSLFSFTKPEREMDWSLANVMVLGHHLHLGHPHTRKKGEGRA